LKFSRVLTTIITNNGFIDQLTGYSDENTIKSKFSGYIIAIMCFLFLTCVKHGKQGDNKTP
jgi:hypothetical protein